MAEEDFKVTFALTRSQMLGTQLGVRVSVRVSGLYGTRRVPGAWHRARVSPASHAPDFFLFVFLFKGSCRKGAGSCFL